MKRIKIKPGETFAIETVKDEVVISKIHCYIESISYKRINGKFKSDVKLNVLEL